MQAQLSALAAEGMDVSGQQPQSSGEGPAYLQWRGSTYTVYGDRLKACMNQASESAPLLEKAQDSGSQEEQLAALEKMVAAFNEAKSIVRHSIATSGGKQKKAISHRACPPCLSALHLTACLMGVDCGWLEVVLCSTSSSKYAET